MSLSGPAESGGLPIGGGVDVGGDVTPFVYGLNLFGELNSGNSDSFRFSFSDASRPIQVGQTFELIRFGGLNGEWNRESFAFDYEGDLSALTGEFGITGNSITFTVQSIPEPSTWLLLALTLLTFKFFRQSGRKSKS